MRDQEKKKSYKKIQNSFYNVSIQVYNIFLIIPWITWNQSKDLSVFSYAMKVAAAFKLIIPPFEYLFDHFHFKLVVFFFQYLIEIWNFDQFS